MNVESFQAFTTGMDAARSGLNDLRESRLRKEMLKRQIAQDKAAEEERGFDRTMKTRQIELQVNADRRAGSRDVAESMERGMKNLTEMRSAWSDQQESLRRGQETQARVGLMNAQAAATAQKPASPLAAQLAGMDEYAEHMAATQLENDDAIAALQMPGLQQDPAAFKAAQARMIKAQTRLSGLAQIAEGWKKQAEKEPTVDLEIIDPSSNGKIKTSVPWSKWNDSHPMFKQFNKTPETPAAANAVPVLSPAQAAAAAPGTKYRTQDGRMLIR